MPKRQCQISWSDPADLRHIVLLPEDLAPVVAVIAKALSLYVSEQVKKSVDFEQAIKDSPTGGL